jgi:hypothetical protein
MSDMDLAESLMHTCYEMYRQVPVGIAPDIVHFTEQEKHDPKVYEVISLCCENCRPIAYNLLIELLL